jgi:hypothetical protein
MVLNICLQLEHINTSISMNAKPSTFPSRREDVHVRWVPFSPKHGMSSGCRWRVSESISNKQPQKMTKSGSPAWKLGMGITTHHHKKEACYERIYRAWNLNRSLG